MNRFIAQHINGTGFYCLFHLDGGLVLDRPGSDTDKGMVVLPKAGYYKKINKPTNEERESILHFCSIAKGHRTLPVINWLQQNNCSRNNAASPFLAQDKYALFADCTGRLSCRMLK